MLMEISHIFATLNLASNHALVINRRGWSCGVNLEEFYKNQKGFSLHGNI